MKDNKRLACALWLDAVSGLGAKTKRELLEVIKDPIKAWQLSDHEIKELLNAKKAERYRISQRQNEPERLLELLEKKGLRFCYYNEETYPKKLRNIPDPPFGLYYYGSLPKEEEKAAAIVGARVCSGYGKKAAEELGERLAAVKAAVISGMARGVDSFAQRAAVRCNGSSYSVLGCGADICYPEQNRELYEQLKERGGVLSEYLPGTSPVPQLFPPRNRIISGLSDVVLVVEAREKSGTLITVDMALEQGKDVYVLPGRISDPLSAGCNRLISQGAQIVLSIDEFAETVSQKKLPNRSESTAAKEDADAAQPILRSLDYYPKSLEQIEEDSGVDAKEAMLLLLNLCMEGKVRQISSFYFVKT